MLHLVKKKIVIITNYFKNNQTPFINQTAKLKELAVYKTNIFYKQVLKI